MKSNKSKIRQDRNQTGGGPPTETKLSELEEKVASICGTEIEGNPHLEEIGIQSPKLQSTYFFITLA